MEPVGAGGRKSRDRGGLMGRPRTLQKEILIALKKNPIYNITLLASSINHPRPSVSRSIHALIGMGLVIKNDRVIGLSHAGLEAVRGVKVFKRARGSIGWVDDQCAEFKCFCEKWKESSIVSVDGETECEVYFEATNLGRGSNRITR